MMEEILKVLEREEVTSTQKLILIALKVLEASEGASFEEIGFYTSLSRKTVISNINKLEEIGLIEVIRDTTRVNKYIVLPMTKPVTESEKGSKSEAVVNVTEAVETVPEVSSGISEVCDKVLETSGIATPVKLRVINDYENQKQHIDRFCNDCGESVAFDSEECGYCGGTDFDEMDLNEL